MKWKILDTGTALASENMEFDAHLLENLKDEPILHFYDWARPSATYGYFLKTEDFLDLKSVQSYGIDLARRPTGGGIVFHVSDLAFSALVPTNHPEFSQNTMDNYNFINNAVLMAVKNLLHKEALSLLPTQPIHPDQPSSSFCMAGPTKYDVMLGSKKVAGAAQRRRKQGFLHQGSISLALPDLEMLKSLLLPGTRVLEAMQSNTFTLLQEDWTQSDLRKAREAMKEALTQTLGQER